MTSTTLLSDVVLPGGHLVREARPLLHRHAPVRARVLAGDRPAVGGQERLRDLPPHRPARSPTMAETHLGVRKDLVSVPMQHDTPGETAQPGGVVRDWRTTASPGVPGQTMPTLHGRRARLHRDRRQARRDRPAGRHARLHRQERHLPPRGADRGAGPDQRRHARRRRRRPARDRHRRQDGRGDPRLPAPRTASSPCRASGPWRSGSASRWPTWPRARRRSGSPSPTPRPRRSPVITSPEWSGSETGGRRYAPFTVNVERLKPLHTLTGRMHFFLDHDWMSDLGEALPIYRPPLDLHRLLGEPELGPDGAKQVTVRYLTPHSKWSIHSEYQDNLFMLSLSRGGPTVWMSPEDAESIEVRDNDWVECVNANGVLVCRAIVSHRMPAGVVFVHHAQERTIDVPKSEATGRRGGIHNSVTRLLVKPTHLIGGYAQLSYAFNYLGPTGNQRDMVTTIRRRSPGGDVLMRVMAQMGMVMNLDKCIGCHTCSVTCKQAWTNRAGVEYVWFNNVETRPGQGYPRRHEDQEKWHGGWQLNRRGRLQLRTGGRLKKLLTHLRQPGAAQPAGLLRAVDLRLPHPGRRAAGRRLPGGPAEVADHRRGHEDHLVGQLGRQPRRHLRDGSPRPDRREGAPGVRGQDQVRVRADLHVLPAADLRALPEPVVHGLLPVRRDLQAGRGRHRARRPGPLPRLAAVHHRLPVQEDLLQPQDRQGREVHVLLPAHRGRPADGVLGDLRRPAALPRAVPLRRRRGHRRRVGDGREGPLPGAARPDPRPERPRGGRGGARAGHPRGLAGRGPPLPGLRAGQEVPGGAAAAPGVPHHADGLVRPAAVAGRRPAERAGPRRRGPRQPVRRHRGAAHPGGVPRRAVHRRRHRDRQRGAAQARRDAVLHARASRSAGSRTRRSRRRSG